MNARSGSVFLVLTCTAAGALGGRALHGETKPPAYLIGQIDVTDPNGYAKEYLPKAREIIKAHGGKLVAAAGSAATGSQVVGVDGDPPKRVVIYIYPNLEALQLANRPGLREGPGRWREIRRRTTHFAVEGPVAK